jgi:hypothetical protein
MSRIVRSCRCAGPATVLALTLSLTTAGTVAGQSEAGRSYQVDLYGEGVTAQGAEVGAFDPESGMTTLRVRFPNGEGRTLYTVRLRPTWLAPLSD